MRAGSTTFNTAHPLPAASDSPFAAIITPNDSAGAVPVVASDSAEGDPSPLLRLPLPPAESQLRYHLTVRNVARHATTTRPSAW